MQTWPEKEKKWTKRNEQTSMCQFCLEKRETTMLAIQNKKQQGTFRIYNLDRSISYLGHHITAVIRKLTTWEDLVGLELPFSHRQSIDFCRHDLEVMMVRLVQLISRIYISIHGINLGLDIIGNARLLAGSDLRTS